MAEGSGEGEADFKERVKCETEPRRTMHEGMRSTWPAEIGKKDLHPLGLEKRGKVSCRQRGEEVGDHV